MQKHKENGMVIKAALQWAVGQLGKEKRLEAELLLAHIVSWNRASLLAHDDELLTGEQQEQFCAVVERRRQQEPLQYLLGKTSFMGMELVVRPGVLIPRFDTEQLVEYSLQRLQGRVAPKVADICTGSGAIAISIAKYHPDAQVWAVDLSTEALAVAAENNRLQQTNVRLWQGDLLQPFGEEFYKQFDAIVSNPPYITSGEMKQLPQEVLQEPHMALWGGPDGLDFYRRITVQAEQYLRPGGYLIFEIGYTQGQAVQELLVQYGYEQITLLQDWQGLDRVASGQRKA